MVPDQDHQEECPGNAAEHDHRFRRLRLNHLLCVTITDSLHQLGPPKNGPTIGDNFKKTAEKLFKNMINWALYHDLAKI